MALLTPARQRNAVSEGFAFGLVLRGRWSLRHDKLAVDLSFEAAWCNWKYRSRFSQVDTDLRNGSDPIWVMTHGGVKNSVWILYWTVDREILISSRDEEWSPDDPDDVEYAISRIDGEVPKEGWLELVDSFLARFDRPA